MDTKKIGAFLKQCRLQKKMLDRRVKNTIIYINGLS